jgi:transposase
MTEDHRAAVLRVFAASCSRRGAKGLNDRRFLEALHYFTVHNITGRALPEGFGNWNSIWNRFWRLIAAFTCVESALASSMPHFLRRTGSTSP